MFPSFLITFREVVEATVIVATILGIITQLKWSKGIQIVWQATGLAAGASILLIGAGSIFGFNLQKLYSGKIEQITEGSMMILSALFITWTVFFLHKFFSQRKGVLLKKVKQTLIEQQTNGLFILVFTAVFREGFEIALFLASIYFSAKPLEIAGGFMGGLLGGLLLSFIIFKTTSRIPVQYAFRISSYLLIVFAAGLIVRGVHEFMEAGFIPELLSFGIPLIPNGGTFMSDMIKSLFGITQKMDIVQITIYFFYTGVMSYLIKA
jgi:high-affinity iron transporter